MYKKTIESGLEQAQNQKLSHTLFPNDILVKIKEKIDQTTQENNFIYYVTTITDLFQILHSYVYQPGHKTISLLLHVPTCQARVLTQFQSIFTLSFNSQSFSKPHFNAFCRAN